MVSSEGGHRCQSPLDDYDILTAKQIVPLLTTLDSTALRAVRLREKSGKHRVTVLRSIESLLALRAERLRRSPRSSSTGAAHAERPLDLVSTAPSADAQPMAAAPTARGVIRLPWRLVVGGALLVLVIGVVAGFVASGNSAKTVSAGGGPSPSPTTVAPAANAPTPPTTTATTSPPTAPLMTPPSAPPATADAKSATASWLSANLRQLQAIGRDMKAVRDSGSQGDATGMLGACRSAQGHVQTLEAALPVPEPSINAPLSRALALYDAGMGDCAQAVMDMDEASAQRSAAEITEGNAYIVQTTTAIDAYSFS